MLYTYNDTLQCITYAVICSEPCINVIDIYVIYARMTLHLVTSYTRITWSYWHIYICIGMSWRVVLMWCGMCYTQFTYMVFYIGDILEYIIIYVYKYNTLNKMHGLIQYIYIYKAYIYYIVNNVSTNIFKSKFYRRQLSIIFKLFQKLIWNSTCHGRLIFGQGNLSNST